MKNFTILVLSAVVLLLGAVLYAQDRHVHQLEEAVNRVNDATHMLRGYNASPSAQKLIQDATGELEDAVNKLNEAIRRDSHAGQ